jgi:deferrochelatase/peroxidase EfeB
VSLDLADIQGNILRGWRFHHARHFALGIGDGAAARRFVAALIPGSPETMPQVTTAEIWHKNEKPDHCMNAGFTSAGLQALGVPEPVLAAFPPAFQQGPAVRAAAEDPDFPGGVGLGDVGPSAPENWILGGGTAGPAHVLLSLYAHDTERLESCSDRLRAGFAEHGITEVSHHDATALPGGRAHFGYRDGIAQPRIRGGARGAPPDMQPEADTGDFLLGRDYVSLYGGNFLGDLPAALGDNATYGAFRILRQDVAAFEQLLQRWGQAAGMDPELVAAKLMGRWRNGVPLVLSPDTPEPDPGIPHLNEFDYAPGPGHPAFYDDADGRRCPVGAHVRRLNPRGALVMGTPHSRRIVRRGMPYGPEFDPGAPDDGVERGLLGYFLCGDLELQFEFIQRVWANEDLSTHGLRGTREPIVGAQPKTGGTFTIRTDDARDPIVLGGLPTLVQTRGSVYCLLPGIGGLRYLASLDGAQAAAR